MRTASAPARLLIAALLAMLLGLRLVGASGYMPGLDHGVVTIVACPDAEVEAPLAIGSAHRHHGHSGHQHGGLCPFASASSVGALGVDWRAILVVLFFPAVSLLGRACFRLERNRLRERPPSQGPPLLA
jgi:hypothetical protein